jgi:hypothetical protein
MFDLSFQLVFWLPILLTPLHEQYNLEGQPYIHGTPSLRPQVIVPVKDFEWLMRLPDSSLSAPEAMNESAGVAHLLTAREAATDKVATVAISQHLTANLGRIQADLVDELQLSLDQVLGLDTHNWQSLRIFPAMEQVITQITTRIMFGLPLCRDTSYLCTVNRCTRYFGAGMLVSAQLLPWFLQPVLSMLFRIPLYFAFRTLSLYTKPLITEWMAQVEQEDAELGNNGSEVPYNLATSVIRIARKHNIDAQRITSCINEIVSIISCSLNLSR